MLRRTLPGRVEPKHAASFAALGDATRLGMVVRLSDGSTMSITQLAEGTALTRQAVTKHLRVLEGAGLVRCQRHGRESLFALEPKRVTEMRAYLDRISKTWDERLQRLKAVVEAR